ncbi:hypothetical protein G6F70_009124 [Rhizopus microsporus]|nr:hypothetical protein G6F71_009092 [Rhizopus microsporus]KAG1193068.1 hypothetical protein G6F70_009124 [Rhizopus microsporus]KAG1206059.1 hypothetical protein G6F69_009103 [Rhizopus microsporus]KAG1226126.1 hypothetical protein G6F67_009101 [Rhizopus microsporus]
MIVNTNFSVLKNNDVKGFWAGMLDAERRDANLNQYNQIAFINQTQEQYANPPPPNKRKSSEPTASPVTAVEINSFEESDSLHIEGLEESVATWVGREGRATIVVDRKTRYFNALGMNGILDLSDNSESSQFSKFPVELQIEIKQLFSPPTVTTPCIDERYAEIQQEIQLTSNENGRYYKRYLEKLNMFKTNEKYDSKLLSEGDYVVKVWGPLLETLFRGSGTVLHWGDTVAENIKATGRNIKMDLRIISSLNNEKMVPNLATGEIAKDIWMSKFYKDKLKTVLSSKMDLNQFVESFPKSYKSTLPVYIPFIIMAALEATVYALYLGSNGLYIINEVATISLPRTLFEVKDGRISKVVSSLNIVKKLVVDVKQLNQHITELRRIKKRKTIKQLTASQMSSNQDEADCKAWIRPIWFPPKYESDPDDA